MPSDIRDYPSRIDRPESRKYETFSYLPAMDANGLRQQVEYMVEMGWTPCIEHCEPERTMDHYWYMWKLPLFGEREVDGVMNELNACRNANPGHHIRLTAYDRKRQTQGLSMIVYRAAA